MNPLDLYAPTDATDGEVKAIDHTETIIDSFDGRRLFESGNFQMDDTDGMFDMYGLPRVFDARFAGKSWDEMTPDEHARWNALADAIKAFALDRLDHDKVMDAHIDGDLAA